MALILKNINKSFSKHQVLKDINLTLPNKGIVLIEGENGSGKTTLLNIISLMDNSFEGDLVYNDINLDKLSKLKQEAFRNNNISYCFQKNNLISYLSSNQNENLDLILENKKIKSNKKIINNLSQGQQQLLALNYSLKEGKKIYLLDEITACLDKNNVNIVIEKIKKLSKNALVIIVSHLGELKEIANFIYHLNKGNISVEKSEDVNNEKIDVEIKNKSKLNILLLFNSFKNSLSVHLFTTFISIIFCGLIILGGFILLEEPKNFINNSFSNLNYLTLEYNNFENNELIEKKYPNDIYKYVGGRIVNEEGKGVNFSDDINLMDYGFHRSKSEQLVIFDYNINEDNVIYLNSNYANEILNATKDKFNSIDELRVNVRYNGKVYILPLKINDNYQENFMYFNPNLLSNYISKVDICYDFDKNGFWNTTSQKGYYYKNKIHYVNKNYAEFRFNIKIEEELEDDTIYLFDNEISDKFYIEKAEFEDAPASKNEDYHPNLKEVFPNGLNMDRLYDIDVNFFSDWFYVVLSDNTLQKIFDNCPKYNLLLNLKNREEKFDFLSRNNISFSYEPNAESKDLVNYIKDIYNGSLNFNKIIYYKTDLMAAFWVRILFITSIVCQIVIELFYAFFIIYTNKKNNIILKKMGLNEFKIDFINFFPSIIRFILVIPLGYIFALIVSVDPVSQFGYLPIINLKTFLLIASLCILSLFLSCSFYKRVERK